MSARPVGPRGEPFPWRTFEEVVGEYLTQATGARSEPDRAARYLDARRAAWDEALAKGPPR